METLDIDRGVFELYVPMGVEPTGEVWRKVEGVCYVVYDDLKRRLGDAVNEKALQAVREWKGLPEELRMPGYYTDEGLLLWLSLPKLLMRYVCLEAFGRCVAMNDVVLTSAGFGVVNTQNVAPASAHRVEALREDLRRAVGDAYDDIVDACMGANMIPEPVRGMCEQLVPTARVARRIGVALPDGRPVYGEDIDLMASELWEAQGAVEREFGVEFVRGRATLQGRSGERGYDLLLALRGAVADYIRAGGVGVQWRETCWGRMMRHYDAWRGYLDNTPYAKRMRQAPDLDGRPDGNAFFFG